MKIEDEVSISGWSAALFRSLPWVAGVASVVVGVIGVSGFFETATLISVGGAVAALVTALISLQSFSKRFTQAYEARLLLIVYKRMKYATLANQKAFAKPALSVTYLGHRRAQTAVAKFGLVTAAVVLGAVQWFVPELDLLAPCIVCLVIVGAMILQEALLEARIRSGRFGDNFVEARDFIEYLRENAKRIDFQDGDGGARRALEPISELIPHDVLGQNPGGTAPA